MSKWKADKVRGVWLKLSKENSHLIDIAVKVANFSYHHAKDDYVMLTKWMTQNEASKFPLFASHYVGVGGLVLNKEKTRVLCIQEARSHFKGLWKIPGGAVDPGESIQDAVIREVWEETGIQTRFKGIVAFRELK